MKWSRTGPVVQTLEGHPIRITFRTTDFEYGLYVDGVFEGVYPEAGLAKAVGERIATERCDG